MTPVWPTDAPTIVFAGGGTGGHLYPALATADALKKRVHNIKCVFFGSTRSIDREIVCSAGWEFVGQDLSPLPRRPWRIPRFAGDINRSRRSFAEFVRRRRPIAVLGSGGLACVPPILEARSAGVPCALFNPDAKPGRANRYLARRVDVIMAQWKATLDHLPRHCKALVTGCPVRLEFRNASRSKGIDRFGLDRSKKTLLVTGASQGAHTMNVCVPILSALWAEFGGAWQVLHLTGRDDLELVRRAYQDQSILAKSIAYTGDMADAMAAADLIVSRAGASTLAEITALGRACVLMPYPFHRDMHQLANAGVLVAAGAGCVVRDDVDAERNRGRLEDALRPLLINDEKRAIMAEAARRLGCLDGAERVADQLLAIATPIQNVDIAESLEPVS